MKPAPFTYHRADSVAQAVAMLAELGDEAKILAGGLSLVPMMNFRLARPSALVDVSRISELSYIRAGDDGLRIGALTTHRAVELSVLPGFGVLPRAARWIGHYPIRARGTFGGSVAHADPASEWCLLAVLLDARMVVTGPSGERTIGAGDFFEGFYTTALEPDEMITEIWFPDPAPAAALTEFAVRQGDFAIVSAGVRLDLADGVCLGGRVVLGGVGPLPVIADTGPLAGQPATQATWETMGEHAAAQIDPPADTHGDPAYRRRLAATLVSRALAEACAPQSLPRSPVTTWVGASLPRKEDRRLLTGRGRFVADMSRPRMLHAVFVRSPHPSARILGIAVHDAVKAAGVAAVFTSADLGDPYLLAVLERDEFVPTRMPVLAGERVRFAGEPVALVLADDAYRAEDAAELVEVEWGETPPGDPVHAAAPDNCLVDLQLFDDPAVPGIIKSAPVVITARFGSARVAALPLEGRACLAEWDDRDEQLVLHVSTQVPHQVRSGVAQALGLPERCIRVIAPDVGGGFGLKCVVGREEVAVAAAAYRLRRPVLWIEDRQENLTASFHGHEQRYAVTAAFTADGDLLALDADIECDTGAYSAFPFTCAVEPLMAATELPGIYRVPAYRARGRAVASHKPPTAPYRGVSRPQIVLVMERLMEKAAARLGLDPLDVRRRNMITAFPYTGVTGITYDEGSYLESLDVAEAETTSWRPERAELRAQGLRAGIGFSCFSERTAYGTPTMSQRRMRMTPGYDTALVRMDPTGEVIVTTGTCGHGQGHETTFAQIVADRLGVDPGQVRLRQGDTDLAAYGWGTWGSRSVVIGGGAASRAAGLVADQLRGIAAVLLEASPDDVVLTAGAARVRGDIDASITVAELARIAHFQAHRLPADLRYGLQATASFDPPGTFSNACHVAMVVIDPGTLSVRLRRYLVVEDCGVVINPLIVDGQVRGGVAQGVAAALLERLCYDDAGQPLTGTLMDYLAPTAAELCDIDVIHLQTPSAHSETGAKGMGEGGMIGGPAAVLNAIDDAMSDTSVSYDYIPVLPQDLL